MGIFDIKAAEQAIPNTFADERVEKERSSIRIWETQFFKASIAKSSVVFAEQDLLTDADSPRISLNDDLE